MKTINLAEIFLISAQNDCGIYIFAFLKKGSITRITHEEAVFLIKQASNAEQALALFHQEYAAITASDTPKKWYLSLKGSALEPVQTEQISSTLTQYYDSQQVLPKNSIPTCAGRA